MKYPLYRIGRVIITLLMKVFYRVEYINLDNLPKEKPFILAGNHKSNLDCLLLISSTKRMIHFLAKKELMQHFGWLFKRMGIIPVDRKKKNKEALEESNKVLKNNGVIGIFPEGTFNKSPYIILPFKYGCVKIAKDANCMIVPFAIINDYKFLRRSVKVVFDKGYYLKNKDDLKEENIKLMNKVIKLLRSGEIEK